MSTIMTLGEKIKFLREERDLLQIDLAEFLKVDRSTITGYETGRRLPDIFMLKRIADFFDVTVDYLLSEEL